MLSFFFFNDTATTEIYTLSLHDALPISENGFWLSDLNVCGTLRMRKAALNAAMTADGKINQSFVEGRLKKTPADRKSTRLNSSHANISYAVFCLKKKTQKKLNNQYTEDH